MAVADVIAAVLLAAGAGWTLVGVLGLLRFPDVYTRLHATGLGSTGGIALLLAGVVVHFATRSITLSILAGLTMIFVLLSYPLASTAIISAAHRTRAPRVAPTSADELEGDEKNASEEADALSAVSGAEVD